MTAPDLLSQSSHFAFGKNWIEYSKKIDERRILQAIADLKRLSGRETFDGLTFLDIGCGSGIHSLAAIRLGATQVLGVDIDPDSVRASQETLSRFAPDARAKFTVMSIFDLSSSRSGTFDIVYSWGVLHHTGDMNRALRVAASLVHENGSILIALYRATRYCGIWRRIKRRYASLGQRGQAAIRRFYLILARTAAVIRGRSFDDYVRNYSDRRGMSFENDVHDWLGGYPYESISPDACHSLFTELDFELEREFVQQTNNWTSGLLGTGCDEFSYRRRAELASS